MSKSKTITIDRDLYQCLNGIVVSAIMYLSDGSPIKRELLKATIRDLPKDWVPYKGSLGKRKPHWLDVMYAKIRFRVTRADQEVLDANDPGIYLNPAHPKFNPNDPRLREPRIFKSP